MPKKKEPIMVHAIMLGISRSLGIEQVYREAQISVILLSNNNDNNNKHCFHLCDLTLNGLGRYVFMQNVIRLCVSIFLGRTRQGRGFIFVRTRVKFKF